MNVLITGLLFFLSGIAGLIYEVVWFRMLGTTFGATAPAMAATTGSFMAGLGIGCYVCGRTVDRIRSPATTYAILEVLIALIAILIPAALTMIESLINSTSLSVEQNGLRLTLQFASIFVLLVVPTSLMGATLPLLTRVVVKKQAHLGSRFAWLYAANTIGAVVGTVLTGFLLVPWLGISRTIFVAAFLNLLAAVGAFWVSRRSGAAPASHVVDAGDVAGPDSVALSEARVTAHDNPVVQDVQTANDEHRTAGGSLKAGGSVVLPASVVFCIVMVTGFVSLGCQYLWTRSLIFSFDRLKNTTYSFSSVLAVTLLGLVLGTFVIGFLIDRIRHLRGLLAALLLMLSGSIVLSVVLLLQLPKLQDSVDPETLQVDFPQAVQNVCVRSLLVIGLPSVLMGMLLPACVRCIAQLRQVGRDVSKLYAWNTMGAVLGACLGAFVITPTFGLLKGILLLAGLELSLVPLVLTANARKGAGMAAAVVGISLCCSLIPTDWTLQSLLVGEHIVGYRDGTMASVCVVENERGERRICVDDVPVAGTSVIMQTDQKSLAHWGMLLAENPRRALTVGFGSGGASWSFLLYDQLEQLDCVEICSDVPAFANLMTDANHGLLDVYEDSDRYRIILADARAYLKRVDHPYDVIVSDCTDLRYRSSANLYDLEYFQLCHDALTDGGCTLIWMPLGGLSQDAFLMTLRTFARVFPEMQVYYLHNRWTHYILLAGHRTPFRLSPDRLDQLLSEEDVKQDLAVIGMTDPRKIAATYLTNAGQLGSLLAGDALNTEDTPRLEFLVPRFDTGPWSAQKNLNLLRQRRASSKGLLSSDISGEQLADYGRFSQAAIRIMNAQEAERETDVERATLDYLEALQLTPEDDAIQEALNFEALQAAGQRGNPTAWLLLGRSFQLQKRYVDAKQMVDRFFSAADSLRQAADKGPESEQRIQQADAWAPTARVWKLEIEQAAATDALTNPADTQAP